MDSEEAATAGDRWRPGGGSRFRPPALPALRRERLDALTSRLWSRRLGMVVAPAGSGKTTLLGQVAAASGMPVAWYRCEPSDRQVGVLLDCLAHSCSTAFAGTSGRWEGVDDAVRALEAGCREPSLLVVDDLHGIAGSPADSALERLVLSLPERLFVLVASRVQPVWDLSRARTADELLEIRGEDLRFRSWEVERLFREHYRQPLPPVELASLARSTEGWAAGLQLFHLATRDRMPEERRRVVSNLSGRSRLVSDYLARNVLDELPQELRQFLVDTAVLARLSGPICDRFLDRRGSAAILRELDRRQVFMQPLDDEGTYRYHEVLRSHLEDTLLQRSGERSLRERYRAAGPILEESGALHEALHAFCRAEAWADVDRVLAQGGEHIAGSSGTWMDTLPPSLLAQDPWLQLAAARRHCAEGRWTPALEAYGRAELGFGGSLATDLCRRERRGLAAWLGTGALPSDAWWNPLRSATRRVPAGPCRPSGTAAAGTESLLAGLRSLLAGRVVAARADLERAAVMAETDAAEAFACLAAGVACLLAGDDRGGAWLRTAAERADALGLAFLARLCRAAPALGGGPEALAEAGEAAFVCERVGDGWGAALACLSEAFGRLVAAEDTKAAGVVGRLERSVAWFTEVDAPVLGAWAQCLVALAGARAGDPAAGAAALAGERAAKQTGAEGACAFAYLALAETRPADRERHLALAAGVLAATGMAPGLLGPAPAAAVTLWLFSSFRVEIGGRTVELVRLKPRARALLRYLALQCGRPRHREVIEAQLWPDADPDSALRCLQVAVSSLRRFLEEEGGGATIARDGEAYRLVLGAGSSIDLMVFEGELLAGRRARVAGDATGAERHLRAALAQHRGELLPEDGPADWLVETRERVTAAAVEAARSAAGLMLDRADPAAAVEVCEQGLAIDRGDDSLWRLLAAAHDRAGSPVAASTARRRYAQVVAELGLVPG